MKEFEQRMHGKKQTRGGVGGAWGNTHLELAARGFVDGGKYRPIMYPSHQHRYMF